MNRFKKCILLMLAGMAFCSCSKKNKSGNSAVSSPCLIQTIANVSENAPLTYRLNKMDDNAMVLFCGQSEVKKIRHVEKIIQSGAKWYVSYLKPVEGMRIWPTKLLCVESTSGNVWAFEDDVESFFADEEFIVVNKKGNAIENYFNVDVISVSNYSVLAKENLFSKLKSFPPYEIHSEIKSCDGIPEIRFYDAWNENFACFNYEKSSGLWKANECNYSKDFWYIPTEAKFCEAKRYKLFPTREISDQMMIVMHGDKLTVEDNAIGNEMLSEENVIGYSLSKSRENLLVIKTEKSDVENIKVINLKKNEILQSIEGTEKVICDEQISKLLYKGKELKLDKKLHYVDVDGGRDNVVSIKTIISRHKNFVDFDFVSLDYPRCELLFEDSGGLQYHVDYDLCSGRFDVIPANRYKKHDLSKYPSLH